MPEQIRILVVEDEAPAREGMLLLLSDAGHQAQGVADAAGALAQMPVFQPHVVLLDLMLPDVGDFSLTQTLAQNSRCGLIIVSGITDQRQRVEGLRAGADDYLAKPIDPSELLLKVQRLASRVMTLPARALAVQDQCGPWRLDRDNACCRHVDGREIILTASEARILGCLMREPERVFTRVELLDQFSQVDESAGSERAVDSCVSRLRRKMERNPGRPVWLISVYGSGYRFCCSNEEDDASDFDQTV